MKKLLSVFLFVFTLPVFATGIGSGSSAPCDNATLSKYTGTADIEINWEPNTIGLKWFNGDQQIAGPTSCVYDSTLTVPTQPTKLGYTFNGWKVIHVPGGFTELEYLQFNGNQWINTGVIFTSKNQKKVITFSSVSAGDGSAVPYAICGTQDGSKRTAYMSLKTNGQMGLGLGDQASGGSVIQINNPNQKTTVTIITTNENKFSVTGGSTDYVNQSTSGTFITGRPEYLGKLNIEATKYSAAFICYAYQLYEDDVLVFNGIPARRNSDNVLGMWDTISQTFFTNSGTGTFTAGPVAQ